VSITISQADAVITVNGFTGAYNGAAHGATGSAVGVESPTPANLTGLLHLGSSFTNVPGGTAHWTFDGNTNYKAASGDVSITISQADAVITVNGFTGIYDGNAHGATGSAHGVEATPVDLNSLLHLGSSFTNVPGGTAHWTFDGNTNYKAASGDVSITISQADANIIVNGYAGVYDASAHGATGSAVGVESPTPSNLSSLLHLGATFTNVPGGTAHWTFDGNTNYKAASGDVSITISRANPTIVATPYSVAYDGYAHTATGTAKGVLNESLSGLNLNGTTHTNPGDYPTDPWTFTDVTGNYNNASGTVHDGIGYGICSVGPGDVILPPINSDGTSVYQRKGGSTIPVKFRVCNASGASISNPAVVFAGTGGTLTMLSAVRGTINNINEIDGTDIPDVAFRWDASGQQWIFNMATSNLTSGSTYAFRINVAYAPASITFVVGVK
jgi:hypothetical protein